jgi:hypothetical protein
MPRAPRKPREPIKVEKDTAKYTPNGTRQEHCGICSHYAPDGWPGVCEKVQGAVVPQGWCKFFHKKIGGPRR